VPDDKPVAISTWNRIIAVLESVQHFEKRTQTSLCVNRDGTSLKFLRKGMYPVEISAMAVDIFIGRDYEKKE
jgi:hypothetical protein